MIPENDAKQSLETLLLFAGNQSTHFLLLKSGIGKCPMTWGYWTSPEKVAIIDHIPNGWVMFNGDI